MALFEIELKCKEKEVSTHPDTRQKQGMLLSAIIEQNNGHHC